MIKKYVSPTYGFHLSAYYYYICLLSTIFALVQPVKQQDGEDGGQGHGLSANELSATHESSISSRNYLPNPPQSSRGTQNLHPA
nr:hypothetical protein CFP56_29449 [Quercus suber]